jgi:hypothetical protein
MAIRNAIEMCELLPSIHTSVSINSSIHPSTSTHPLNPTQTARPLTHLEDFNVDAVPLDHPHPPQDLEPLGIHVGTKHLLAGTQRLWLVGRMGLE